MMATRKESLILGGAQVYLDTRHSRPPAAQKDKWQSDTQMDC